MAGGDVEPVENGKSCGEPLEYDANFKGPVANRSCTDIICLVLFLIFFIAFIAVGILGFILGEPRYLIHPSDSNDNLCGINSNDGKPNLFFFDISACARISTEVFNNLGALGCFTPQVCVKDCPDYYWSLIETKGLELAYNAALEADSGVDTAKTALLASRNKMICKDDIDKTDLTRDAEDFIKADECAPYILESTPVVDRCVPQVAVDVVEKTVDILLVKDTDGNDMTLLDADGKNITTNDVTEAIKGLTKLLDVVSIGQKVVADFKQIWWQILGFFVIAMVVSFIYIVLMRWIAGIMVWITIFLFTALFSFLTYYTVTKYIDLKDTEDGSKPYILTTNLTYYLELATTWLVLAIVCGVILLITILVLIFLRSHIMIAIQLIKEGSRAVGSMLFTLIFPVFPFLLELAAIAYFLGAVLYVMSIVKTNQALGNSTTAARTQLFNTLSTFGDEFGCGDTDINKTHVEKTICNSLAGNLSVEQWQQYTTYVQIFLFFTGLWVLNFITALGELVLAGAFAGYYWTFDKDNDLPTFPILGSLWRALRYHIGSLAFGALIITIVQMIRAFLEYVDHKLNGSENPLAKFMIKCLKCCFWCLEKLLRFINRNAYIMIAVHGKNFCASAKDAFFLLLRNVARVVVLDKVTDFLFLLGKLTVVAGNSALAFYWFSGRISAKVEQTQAFQAQLNYYPVPIAVVVIGSYLVAKCFFSVYEMGVDTLFLCFLEDIERNDGSPQKPYFMNTELKEILGKQNVKPTTENGNQF